MDPAYVEDGAFNCVLDQQIGCDGRRLRHRIYVLKGNPDQRAPGHMAFSAVAAWAQAGAPVDVVFHLGEFHRLTDLDTPQDAQP